MYMPVCVEEKCMSLFVVGSILVILVHQGLGYANRYMRVVNVFVVLYAAKKGYKSFRAMF